MLRKEFWAGKLSEINDVIRSIHEEPRHPASGNQKPGYSEPESKNHPVLWFRGHSNGNYYLIPTLFREDASLFEPNDNGTYSGLHLTEDYRFHSFRAKTGHQILTNPASVLEWQEVMQHHSVGTRLLDWSESLVSALLFALEPLFQNSDDIGVKAKRKKLNPAIWILEPQELNKQVFNMITKYVKGRYPLIEKALESVVNTSCNRKKCAEKIGEELSKNPNRYFCDEAKTHISGLINLSAIEESRRNYGPHLLKAVLNFEFNPFHFVLLRLYSDRIISTIEGDRPKEILPPLATIHQYHSMRIQAQKGVFLVVPHYKLDEAAKNLYNRCGIDLRAIEFQPNCRNCRTKIVVSDPQGVAEELRNAGEHRASIYPEVPEYALEIEFGDKII